LDHELAETIVREAAAIQRSLGGDSEHLDENVEELVAGGMSREGSNARGPA